MPRPYSQGAQGFLSGSATPAPACHPRRRPGAGVTSPAPRREPARVGISRPRPRHLLGVLPGADQGLFVSPRRRAQQVDLARSRGSHPLPWRSPPKLARTQSRITTGRSPAHGLRVGARRRQDVTRPGRRGFFPVSEQTRARPPGSPSACPHLAAISRPPLGEHRPADPLAPVRRFLVARKAISLGRRGSSVMAARWTLPTAGGRYARGLRRLRRDPGQPSGLWMALRPAPGAVANILGRVVARSHDTEELHMHQSPEDRASASSERSLPHGYELACHPAVRPGLPPPRRGLACPARYRLACRAR
jgi:hypothetical protein